MRQDSSPCQHSQHIQPRMRNVISSWKNCTTIYFTVSCSVLRLLHVLHTYLFIALYDIYSGKPSSILLLCHEPLKTLMDLLKCQDAEVKVLELVLL